MKEQAGTFLPLHIGCGCPAPSALLPAPRASPTQGCRAVPGAGQAQLLPSCCSSAQCKEWKSPGLEENGAERRLLQILCSHSALQVCAATEQISQLPFGGCFVLFNLHFFYWSSSLCQPGYLGKTRRVISWLRYKYTAQLLPQALRVHVQYFSCFSSWLQSPQVLCISQILCRPGLKLQIVWAVNRIPFNSFLIPTFKMFWCN